MNNEKPSPEGPKRHKTEDKSQDKKQSSKEFGGFESKKLPEPTRFGDWEVGGRCSDF